jgi:CheY-like chemotaxis protein
VVVEVNREIKSTKEVTFEYEIDSRIPKELIGDPVRMTQIITNLLKNLKSNATEGVIKTHIQKSELVDNELTLKIDLVSTQCKAGTFEHFSHIFNDANDNETLENEKDGDFELIVARRLVELQNGTINVVKANNGVALSLFLPFKLAETEISEQKTEGVMAMVAQANFLEGKMVLVVEDNKVNQMLVANMLKKKGIIVATANDGLDGLEAVSKSDYDLILMDIQMPRMDGYRAVAEIRKMKDSIKANVPIIALTASAYVNEKEKAQLFGMTDHIGKPFSPEELLDKITRVLLTHRTEKDNTESQQPVKV